MKNCPYCSKEIVDDAVICVHCGRALKPLEKPQKIVVKKKTSFATWGCLTIIILIVVLYFIGSRVSKSPIEVENAKFLPPEEMPKSETEPEKPRFTIAQIIARRTKAREFIDLLNSDKMRQVGLIYKAERAFGSTMGLHIYVTANWYLSPYDDKIGFLNTFYVQWKSTNEGEGWIEVRDFRTGKRIAKCDAWGPKIY